MQIHELWHYPVKGLGGNQMPSARLRKVAIFPMTGNLPFRLAAKKPQLPAMVHGCQKRISCN